MLKKTFTKYEIRNMFKNTIDHIDRDTKNIDIQKMLKLLINRPEFTKAKVIAFYWPKINELDVIPMIDFSLFNGKRVVLPYIGENKKMVFKEIQTVEFKREKFMGIIQPTKDHDTVEKEEINMFVLPTMAFNKQGYRVGSGHGYYDRYLEESDNISIVIMALSSREKMFKYDAFDKPADIIITEKKLFKIHADGYVMDEQDELLIPTLEIKIDSVEPIKVDIEHVVDNIEVEANGHTKNIASKEDEKDVALEENKEEEEIKSKFDFQEDTAEHSFEKTISKTITAMGMTPKEVERKRKQEIKLAKLKLKKQKEQAKKLAKEALQDNSEDDLRKKLAKDETKKPRKDDLSDIPDADKLLAILEAKEEKPKKEKQIKPKKEKKLKKFK